MGGPGSGPRPGRGRVPANDDRSHAYAARKRLQEVREALKTRAEVVEMSYLKKPPESRDQWFFGEGSSTRSRIDPKSASISRGELTVREEKGKSIKIKLNQISTINGTNIHRNYQLRTNTGLR